MSDPEFPRILKDDVENIESFAFWFKEKWPMDNIVCVGILESEMRKVWVNKFHLDIKTGMTFDDWLDQNKPFYYIAIARAFLNTYKLVGYGPFYSRNDIVPRNILATRHLGGRKIRRRKSRNLKNQKRKTRKGKKVK